MIQLRLPTAVVGLGLSGQSVLRLLQTAGIPRSQILLFDAKDPSADFKDPSDLLKRAPKSLVVSPGVPLAHDWIQAFRQGGGQITSELEIASSFLTTEKIIGVTGSIGKSTCTSLLQAGLAEFCPRFFVGGNLGFPLADYATRKLQGGPVAEWVVLELSSYQLENYANLRCDAALLTYLTPNHLERYPDLESYYRSKWVLVEKTRGPIVMNENGGDLRKFADSMPASGLIWTSAQDPQLRDLDYAKAQLVGDHNRDNIALVTKLSRALAWPASAEAGLMKFPGLPHRLENLGLHAGVRWINDSKATTMESVLQAVRSTESLASGVVHILLGGKDKNLPWEQLASLKSDRRHFYFFGEVRAVASRKSGLPGTNFEHLKDAVLAVKKSARPGDLVLFSPGGTSLDEFKSFETRGNFFKSQVQD